MNSEPTVLLTGPVERLAEWADAVRGVDWVPIEWPLVEVVQKDIDLVETIDGLPDWLAITSGSALPALERAARSVPELLSVPLGVVGAHTGAAAERAGFKLGPPPAENARELARAIIAESSPGAQVLWPRGSLAQEFGRRLEEAGLAVADPVVYETEVAHHEGPPPPTEAVFFASPSAVRAFFEDEGREGLRRAVAIGSTTLAELEACGAEGASALPEPTPEALAQRLREFRDTH